MPYDAFDALPSTPVEVASGNLEVAIAPGQMLLSRAELLDWVRRSAHAVAVYYGRFPVRSARVLIVPVEGRGVLGGQAWGYRGAAIRLQVGRNSNSQDLKADWKMVHEMIHLALPDLAEQHLWLAEGIAVYVESVARVQAGDLRAEQIWGDFVRDMPKGLPNEGDQGLDHTHSWGRTYWGGALFCLAADVELRKQSQNKIGLQDALRGILEAGGNHEMAWEIEGILSTADKATGLSVLSTTYREVRDAPAAPDLPKLWRVLGVKSMDGAVSFDDEAPLASIRQNITLPKS
jgi:hypothetical protein